MELARAEELARRWYQGRLSPEWRPRAKAETQALLTELGLVSSFWRL